MAATPALLRSGLAELNRRSALDLSAIWLRVQSAAEAGEALRDLLPGLVDAYGAAAAALAAEWYEQLREEQSIPGRFGAIPADSTETGTQQLIGWALATAENDDTFKSLILGGLQRRITNFARGTVSGSAIADPHADGWQRVARGDGCGFCQMLAGRGAVYTEASADFASHDDCNCTATVAWRNRPVPVKPYTPSARHLTDADRARARDWMRANGLTP